MDTRLVLKFEWGQRGQAVLRFEWKSGWDQTGKLELASTLTFGFVNPAGTEPYFLLYYSYELSRFGEPTLDMFPGEP